jgi:hypothetical protein
MGSDGQSNNHVLPRKTKSSSGERITDTKVVASSTRRSSSSWLFGMRLVPPGGKYMEAKEPLASKTGVSR